MGWLRAIDEAAGSRDRATESKPSTYCTMEFVDADEAENDLEPSPTLLPAPMSNMADIPALSLRVPAELPQHPTSMPDGASILGRPMVDNPAAAMAMSHAMATAAAAALVSAGVNAPPPPPLAWLIQQHMAHALATGAHLSPAAASLLTPEAMAAAAAMRTELPAALAAQTAQAAALATAAAAMSAQQPSTSAPSSAAWNHGAFGGAPLGGTFGGALGVPIGNAPPPPVSPLAPLPAHGAWDDLDDLFARATQDSRTDEEDGEDRDKPGDPLCLSPPMLNAMAAARIAPSPFDLGANEGVARPVPVAPSSSSGAGAGAGPSTSIAGASSGVKLLSSSPQTTMASGLEKPSAAAMPPLLPSGSIDGLEDLKDSEYSEFIDCLLANDLIHDPVL